MSCADEQALPWTPASMARPGPLPVGWRILKRSWRGCYERALVVVDGWLLTLEPASGRTTNTWPLADVLGVERRGAADVALRLAGPCGAAGWVQRGSRGDACRLPLQEVRLRAGASGDSPSSSDSPKPTSRPT